jgi:tetratricopeptide (TPR) repeat protein
LAKNLALSLLAPTLLFALAEAILAVAGVQPRSRTEDPFVGFAQGSPLFLPGKDSVSGAEVFRTNPVKLTHFNPQSFPKIKAEGTYRVFCLGGSSTYGRPYRDPTSFCGQLRAFLKAGYPERHFEVINAGGISYASYRVAELIKELGHYQPDLYFVYSGHNEFLEERTYRSQSATPSWIRETSTWLDKTRVYTALRRWMDKIYEGNTNPPAGHTAKAPKSSLTSDPATSSSPTQPLPDKDERFRMSGEVNDVLSHTMGPTSYERNDSLRIEILKHYRFSLARMVRLAHEQKVAILLTTTPSNERSCSPFKSEFGPNLSPRDQAEVAGRMRAGEAAWQAGDSAAALDWFLKASQGDPRHATIAYRVGEIALALHQDSLAEQYFVRALVEDVCPLRALPEQENAVREIARQEKALLLDFSDTLRAAIRKREGHVILGEPEFLDHVHPSPSVHRQLALSALALLQEKGILPKTPPEATTRIQAAAEAVEHSIDDAEKALALHNVAKVTNWAGKHDDAARIAERALELDTLGPESIGSSLYVGAYREREGRGLEALPYYRRAVRLDSNNSQAWMYLASGLRRNGFLEEASRAAEFALFLAPDDPDVLEEAGHAALSRQEWRKAAALFGRATTLAPKEETTRFRAAALLSAGDLAAAQAAFQVLRQRYPGSPWGIIGLGDVAAARGDTQRALEAYSAVAQGGEGYPAQLARKKLSGLLSSGAFSGMGSSPVPQAPGSSAAPANSPSTQATSP